LQKKTAATITPPARVEVVFVSKGCFSGWENVLTVLGFIKQPHVRCDDEDTVFSSKR
jgi:hypothetical protein